MLFPVLPFLDLSGLPRKNPQINQGFLSPAKPTKTLEKPRENTHLSKEIPCLKLTKEFQKTKERKDRVASLSIRSKGHPGSNAANTPIFASTCASCQCQNSVQQMMSGEYCRRVSPDTAC